MVNGMNRVLWGQYEVQGEIRRGGMARILQVIDQRDGQVYAAKIVREDIQQKNPHVLPQFKQEADIHPRLQHPSIVGCLRSYVDEEPPGLVLQYIEGGSLRQLIGEIRAGELIKILKQVSDALTYLHKEHRICHCDLKPDNVLYDNHGHYYLTDFGISQSIGQEPETHRGTPRYMPPEQHLNQILDERTDVYSLGIMVYELITGQTPFSNDDPEGSGTNISSGAGGLAEKHIYSAPPPPSYFDQELSLFDEVLVRALAKSKEDRQQSVEELHQDIKKAVRLGMRQTKSRQRDQTLATLPPARLVCTMGSAQRIRNVELMERITRQAILIGRSRECNLQLRSMAVSRRHALIQWSDNNNAFVVWDQGSRGGTRVNGKRVVNRSRQLNNGDLISIGPFNFRFELARL